MIKIDSVEFKEQILEYLNRQHYLYQGFDENRHFKILLNFYELSYLIRLIKKDLK